MASHVLEDRAEARRLAEEFHPRIFQEYESPFDLIIPVSMDDMLSVIKDFMRLATAPTLNFGVREDDQYWYLFYMIYHCYDVSFAPIKLIRKADSHADDTESVLIRVRKADKRLDLVSVSHFIFLCQSNSSCRVVIEASTHAIRPYEHGGPCGSYLVYKVFEYNDLNAMGAEQWEQLRQLFHSRGSAKLPDEQVDERMREGNSARLHNHIGDIWNRPEVLFKNLEMKGRISE
jgi:hypothetical protein